MDLENVFCFGFIAQIACDIRSFPHFPNIPLSPLNPCHITHLHDKFVNTILRLESEIL